MNLDLLPEALVAGVALAGLYGLLPISIVLSYRISRTIAFVHAGIAATAALGYWLLALKDPLMPNHIIIWSDGTGVGHRPELDARVALLITVAAGLAAGALYGWVVMSRRIAAASTLTLTIVSLGTMMVLLGTSTVVNVEPEEAPPSPFGTHRFKIGSVYLTANKVATLIIVIAVSAALAVWLSRTHTGLCIRALADDIEAGVWCGIKLRLVGTGVYGLSGALAAMAGVLIAVTAGPNPDDMVILFLRGLALAVVGGMRSLPIAFAAALLLGLLQTCLVLGVFGELNGSWQEIVVSGSLLAAVLGMARLRREKFFLLERQAM
jgi:branched-subunit amino acid ABC-type transport system permease component